MRLRILLEPHHGATYAQILALAKAAEEGRFDAFFRSDHYLGIDANDVTYQPTDSWTTLAGLAVQTERVQLGTLVNASTFRLPGQLAVEVATVAQMSGGRAELGIGAAWYEREHEYFGIPFPPLGERFDRLEEQLAILTGIWDTKPGDRFSFEGFPPRTSGDRNRRFAELAADPRTQVFFESGRRLALTLAELAGSHGADRAAVVCRELTKVHEEIKRGTLAELAAWAAEVSGTDPRLPRAAKGKSRNSKDAGSGAVRGEITLVVAGLGRRSRIARDRAARARDRAAGRRTTRDGDRGGALTPEP